MFVDVISFGAQAEAIAEHVGKGRQLGVTGRLSYRQWEAGDGTPRSKHEVIANQVLFLAVPVNGNGVEPAPAYDIDEPF
jgi:single-strand DNA-binding protein